MKINGKMPKSGKRGHKNGLKGEKWEIRFCEVYKFCVKKSEVQ